MLQILDLNIGCFLHVFRNNICNIIFRKWWGGGPGQRLFGFFSENSSVLLALPIPKGKKELLKNQVVILILKDR